MKQPNPFKDDKRPSEAPGYYSGKNPLKAPPARPEPARGPVDRKANAYVPFSQRGGG